MQGFNIAKAARCLEDAMQSEGFTFKNCLSGDSDDEIATRLVWVVLYAALPKREYIHVNSKYNHVKEPHFTPEQKKEIGRVLLRKDIEKPTEEKPEKHDWILDFI